MEEYKEIYTIGREFGSLGSAIGYKLAEKLGIKCYDKELLQQAAKESGFCQEIFETHDEKPTASFLYSLVMDTYSSMNYSNAPFMDMPLNHKVFLAQFDAIKKLATAESCVIIGRCADYALEDNPKMLSIFVHSELEDRIKRISERLELSERKAKDTIIKNDRQRANYYNYYTSKKWGEARSYDLCLNTSKLDVDDCIEVILKYREMLRKKEK
ncbi:AAA family ATPase [Lachnobacterium bovis]|uniref:Cytidylate kinase n=1 Tax=Lachnobacterium bovis TaxID=140626 RepID=A0A1H9PY08_9FIRM|nr:cytidylate kinase-like family protein [Lachnobacterium bovis]SER53087.1 cytidylate kinase [Lachnobacterium bovis]